MNKLIYHKDYVRSNAEYINLIHAFQCMMELANCTEHDIIDVPEEKKDLTKNLIIRFLTLNKEESIKEYPYKYYLTSDKDYLEVIKYIKRLLSIIIDDDKFIPIIELIDLDIELWINKDKNKFYSSVILQNDDLEQLVLSSFMDIVLNLELEPNKFKRCIKPNCQNFLYAGSPWQKNKLYCSRRCGLAVRQARYYRRKLERSK